MDFKKANFNFSGTEKRLSSGPWESAEEGLGGPWEQAAFQETPSKSPEGGNSTVSQVKWDRTPD